MQFFPQQIQRQRFSAALEVHRRKVAERPGSFPRELSARSSSPLPPTSPSAAINVEDGSSSESPRPAPSTPMRRDWERVSLGPERCLSVERRKSGLNPFALTPEQVRAEGRELRRQRQSDAADRRRSMPATRAADRHRSRDAVDSREKRPSVALNLSEILLRRIREQDSMREVQIARNGCHDVASSPCNIPARQLRSAVENKPMLSPVVASKIKPSNKWKLDLKSGLNPALADIKAELREKWRNELKEELKWEMKQESKSGTGKLKQTPEPKVKKKVEKKLHSKEPKPKKKIAKKVNSKVKSPETLKSEVSKFKKALRDGAKPSSAWIPSSKKASKELPARKAKLEPQQVSNRSDSKTTEMKRSCKQEHVKKAVEKEPWRRRNGKGHHCADRSSTKLALGRTPASRSKATPKKRARASSRLGQGISPAHADSKRRAVTASPNIPGAKRRRLRSKTDARKQFSIPKVQPGRRSDGIASGKSPGKAAISGSGNKVSGSKNKATVVKAGRGKSKCGAIAGTSKSGTKGSDSRIAGAVSSEKSCNSTHIRAVSATRSIKQKVGRPTKKSRDISTTSGLVVKSEIAKKRGRPIKQSTEIKYTPERRTVQVGTQVGKKRGRPRKNNLAPTADSCGLSSGAASAQRRGDVCNKLKQVMKLVRTAAHSLSTPGSIGVSKAKAGKKPGNSPATSRSIQDEACKSAKKGKR